MVKRFIKAENGKVSQVLEYESGNRVEIPVNNDGTVRWLEDTVKVQKSRSKRENVYRSNS